MRERPDALDHVAGPEILVADLGQDLPHLIEPGLVRRQQLGRFGIAQDGSEGLVDLVGYRGSELADDAEAGSMGELSA